MVHATQLAGCRAKVDDNRRAVVLCARILSLRTFAAWSSLDGS